LSSDMPLFSKCMSNRVPSYETPLPTVVRLENYFEFRAFICLA
jgi:hypothetical protein